MAEKKPKLVEFEVPHDATVCYCRSCGAGIYWTESVATGKRMPLSVRTEREREDGQRVAQSHFADCPHARQHRKDRP